MIPPSRTLLLDLDGTLVDSVPDLAAALNRLMRARGLAPFSHPDVTAMVGDGAAALLARAFAARRTAQDTAALADFLADYTANAAVATAPYPGVETGLAALAAAGWRLAVCTNKPEQAARAVLDQLGLSHHFAAIAGGDTFPTRKPDPDHLLRTLDASGGGRAGAMMLGDHHNDVAAAQAAGIGCIFAVWGYGTPEMAGDCPRAASFADVIRLLTPASAPASPPPR